MKLYLGKYRLLFGHSGNSEPKKTNRDTDFVWTTCQRHGQNSNVIILRSAFNECSIALVDLHCISMLTGV